MPSRDSEARLLYIKTWQASHPEKVLAYREKGRLRRRIQGALHYRVNRDRLLAQRRAWRHRNWPRVKMQAQAWVKRRRARLHKVPATLTAVQWEAIKAAHGQRCAYCGRGGVKLTKTTLFH